MLTSVLTSVRGGIHFSMGGNILSGCVVSGGVRGGDGLWQGLLGGGVANVSSSLLSVRLVDKKMGGCCRAGSVGVCVVGGDIDDWGMEVEGGGGGRGWSCCERLCFFFFFLCGFPGESSVASLDISTLGTTS